MKKLFIFLTLALVGSISAQRYSHYFSEIWPDPLPATNTVSAQSVRLESRYLSAFKTTNLVISASFNLVADGTDNLVLHFLRAPEFGLVCSNSPITLTIPATGVAPVTFTTNIPMYGLPYLYWAYSSNANACVLTNLTLWSAYKN